MTNRRVEHIVVRCVVEQEEGAGIKRVRIHAVLLRPHFPQLRNAARVQRLARTESAPAYTWKDIHTYHHLLALCSKTVALLDDFHAVFLRIEARQL